MAVLGVTTLQMGSFNSDLGYFGSGLTVSSIGTSSAPTANLTLWHGMVLEHLLPKRESKTSLTAYNVPSRHDMHCDRRSA